MFSLPSVYLLGRSFFFFNLLVFFFFNLFISKAGCLPKTECSRYKTLRIPFLTPKTLHSKEREEGRLVNSSAKSQVLLFLAEVRLTQNCRERGRECSGLDFFVCLFKLQAVSYFVIVKQCNKCYRGGIQPVFLVFSLEARNRYTNRWAGSWRRSLEQSREHGELQKMETKQECIVVMNPVSVYVYTAIYSYLY